MAPPKLKLPKFPKGYILPAPPGETVIRKKGYSMPEDRYKSMVRRTNTYNTISDIATGVATWGTQMRPPTPEEKEMGRSGWTGRAKLLSNSAAWGIGGVMIGEGMNKVAGKIVGKAVKWNADSKKLYSNISKGKERVLTDSERELLQDELDIRGVLKVQETKEVPGKEYLRTRLNPFGYSIKDKYETMLLNIKSPTSVAHEEYGRNLLTNINAYKQLDATTAAQVNRMDTWNMYLGRPQIRGTNQLYNISPLSTNKNVIYEHNSARRLPYDKNDSPVTEYYKTADEYIRRRVDNTSPVLKGSLYRIQDYDQRLYGTMGGFGIDVQPGMKASPKLIATDVWDLHPFQRVDNYPKFMRNIDVDPAGASITETAIKPKYQKVYDKLSKVEFGTATGLGKPVNVNDVLRRDYVRPELSISEKGSSYSNDELAKIYNTNIWSNIKKNKALLKSYSIPNINIPNLTIQNKRQFGSWLKDQ